MSEKFPTERRSTCKEHVAQMKEIFDKIDKRLPIWVFLASIGIIGAAFSFVSLVSRDNFQATHNRMTAMATINKDALTEVNESLKSISASLNSINVRQAVTASAIKNMEKDIDELKQQKKGRNDEKNKRPNDY